MSSYGKGFAEEQAVHYRLTPKRLSVSLSATQIGRCGDLLVQYELLLRGVESAPLSTDAGVDLVAYAPKAREEQTN